MTPDDFNFDFGDMGTALDDAAAAPQEQHWTGRYKVYVVEPGFDSKDTAQARPIDEHKRLYGSANLDDNFVLIHDTKDGIFRNKDSMNWEMKNRVKDAPEAEREAVADVNNFRELMRKNGLNAVTFYQKERLATSVTRESPAGPYKTSFDYKYPKQMGVGAPTCVSQQNGTGRVDLFYPKMEGTLKGKSQSEVEAENSCTLHSKVGHGDYASSDYLEKKRQANPNARNAEFYWKKFNRDDTAPVAKLEGFHALVGKDWQSLDVIRAANPKSEEGKLLQQNNLHDKDAVRNLEPKTPGGRQMQQKILNGEVVAEHRIGAGAQLLTPDWTKQNRKELYKEACEKSKVSEDIGLKPSNRTAGPQYAVNTGKGIVVDINGDLSAQASNGRAPQEAFGNDRLMVRQSSGNMQTVTKMLEKEKTLSDEVKAEFAKPRGGVVQPDVGMSDGANAQIQSEMAAAAHGPDAASRAGLDQRSQSAVREG